MTKQLEEFFNMEPSLDDEKAEVVKSKEEIMAEAREVYNAFTAAEKVDAALPMVTDLNEHDVEMDNIAQQALKSYKDLCQLGMNVPDMHAGKIFEDAALMLKLALDAADSKVNRKIKMLELQLKKAKLDQNIKDQDSPISSGGVIDRNEIFKYIVETKEK